MAWRKAVAESWYETLREMGIALCEVTGGGGNSNFEGRRGSETVLEIINHVLLKTITCNQNFFLVTSIALLLGVSFIQFSDDFADQKDRIIS